MTVLLVLSAALAKVPALGDQVVALSVTWQGYEAAQPWSKTNPATRTAVATVVAGSARGERYLLTSAQVVEYATFVRAKKHGDPAETTAEIRLVDRESNLALLAVPEPGFFDDLVPAAFARKPVSAGSVSFVRWKDNQLEVTEGRVSRAFTAQSRTGLLAYPALRVTTDLSAGGWSEAVFAGQELAGLTTAQNGSEAVVTPGPFIRQWMAEILAAGSALPTVSDLGVSLQSTRSPALAAWLGLPAPAGLLVLDVARGGPACGVLRRGDVLLAVAGRDLDADGKVRDPVYGLLSLEYLLAGRRPGEILPLRILRDHAVQELALPLRAYTAAHWLVPAHRVDPPGYLVAGGLVFREIDESFNPRALELRFLAQTQRYSPAPGRRRVVVLANVLADPYNLGYHELSELRVDTVNGVQVDSVAAARDAFSRPQGGFHVVTFHPNRRIAEVVLDAATFAEADARIAESFGIAETFRVSAAPPELVPGCE